MRTGKMLIHASVQLKKFINALHHVLANLVTGGGVICNYYLPACRRSRLQLRHAGPADFSFVQPSAQQQQQPPAPQQQQQGSGQGGAAGTNDDPIVIDADEEGHGPSGMQLDNPQQQQQQAAFDPGDWSGAPTCWSL